MSSALASCKKSLRRGSVAQLRNVVLYLKYYQELSPGIIQKSLSSSSVEQLRNVVLYLKYYQELSPGIIQKS